MSASTFDEIRILRFTICHMIYVFANKSIQTNRRRMKMMIMMGMALRPCWSRRLDPGCRGSKAQQAKWSRWSDTQRRAHQSALYFFTFRFVLLLYDNRTSLLWSTLDTTGSLLKAFKGRMSPLIKLEDLLIFLWDTGREGLQI